MDQPYDCVIIGGGVGGLTAAIYLARYQCRICVFDNKTSRASLISETKNFPSYPDGISGNDILTRLRQQYKHYRQPLYLETVTHLKRNKHKLFSIKTEKRTVNAKNIILAMGVIDIEPNVANLKDAIRRKLIRHCLVCDAYEARGKKIAILTNTIKGLKAAYMLSDYSPDVTVINIGKCFVVKPIEAKDIEKRGIKIIQTNRISAIIKAKQIKTLCIEQRSHHYDVIYAALGVAQRTELASQLGVELNREGCVPVDKHKETNIKNCYAIGDIIAGLNQMCVACSDGAIAATEIFNRLKGL